jgi:hypothetical protein
MANASSKWTPEVRAWVESGPGNGNGLDHVRALFKIAYPEWRRGAPQRIADHFDVDRDIVHRVFKARTWKSIPIPEVVNDLAKVLRMPSAVVLFAFMADVHPDAVDQDMYDVLHEVGLMGRDQLAQMHQAATEVASQS